MLLINKQILFSKGSYTNWRVRITTQDDLYDLSRTRSGRSVMDSSYSYYCNESHIIEDLGNIRITNMLKNST